MNSLIVCNTGSDSINKISLEKLLSGKKVINEEVFLELGERPLGPSSICLEKDIAYTTNSYSNSISIINLNILKEESSIYVGAHPNDLVNYDNYLYISCSESNTIVLYDLKERKVVLDIGVNNWPNNIEKCKEKGLIFVSNFQSNNVSVIDINTNKVIKNIKTLEYPTKVKVSNDRTLLYVCESYIGDDKDGYIEIFKLSNLESVYKIKVGKVPMDILEDNKNIYVCNFADGSISIIDKNNYKIQRKITLGGMPKSIITYREVAFVSDYLKGRIMCIDLNKNEIKVITVGKEPNAMTLY